MLKLSQLRCFIAVAEELHFRRAAERLRMAQPGLTRQIQDLERALDARLLERSQRRVQLTPAGQAFLEEGRLALAQIERAQEVARRVARGELGRLTIAAIGSAIYDVLPALLREYAARHPGVELVVREMATPAQPDAILRGEVDVGFLRTPAATPGLATRRIRTESMGVMIPLGHPLAALEEIPLTALQGEPLIIFPARPRPSWADFVIDACRQAGFEPRIVQEAIESAAAVSFVAAGVGAAIVPEGLRVLSRPDVAYRPVAPPAPVTHLTACYREGEPPPVVGSLLEILDEFWPAGKE
jgi:DNA-binding transcriptional LysR family regulator